jgi:uncharacterized membrane protein
MTLAGGAMYLILKSVHVFAVALFLGNIMTGVFWRFHAERSGDPKFIGHTFEGITRSDRFFTIPGVLLIILSGVWAAYEGGLPLLRTGWIFWSLVLFALSGVIFGTWLGPLQRQIAALARASGPFDEAKFKVLAKRWDFWGVLATLAPLIALVLMVLKPEVPAF